MGRLGDWRSKDRKPKVCRYCGVKLDDANWYPSQMKRHDRICKGCYWSKIIEPYRKRNRNRINAHENEYKRRHEIASNHWTFRSKDEIDRPTICPLCGTNSTKAAINFHHWQEDPVVGIWACRKCHNMIHLKGLAVDMTIEEWYHKYEEAKSKPVIINTISKKRGRWS